MSKWTKRIAVLVLIAAPTLGFAVTKIRAHKACPVTPDCPCANAHK